MHCISLCGAANRSSTGATNISQSEEKIDVDDNSVHPAGVDKI